MFQQVLCFNGTVRISIHKYLMYISNNKKDITITIKRTKYYYILIIYLILQTVNFVLIHVKSVLTFIIFIILFNI